MALVSFQEVKSQGGYRVFKWEGMTNGGSPDTASPIKLPGFKDITAYLFGTISGSSVMAIHASPEESSPTLFAPMIAGGSAISLTAANTCALCESVGLWYKPVMTAGDGSTDLDVYILAR